MSPDHRLGFITGVTVLLHRLTALGHGALPVGTSATVASLAVTLEEEIRAICGRYDARNGTSAVSERVAARLRQAPLADQFPLGLPSRLPARGRSAAPAAATAVPGPAGGSGGCAGIDALIARAQELAEMRHPGTGEAWARVGRGRRGPARSRRRAGRPVPGRAAAAGRPGGRPIRRCWTSPRSSPRSGISSGNSKPARPPPTRPRYAAKAGAAGPDGWGLDGWGLINAVLEEATAAYADGQMTPRYFLNVVMVSHFMRLQDLADADERTPAEVERFASGLESARALAERHDDWFHVGQCRDLLSHVAAWDGDEDARIRHLTAARESFLAGNLPWYAAQPEAMLAEHALRAGDPEQAEALAADALAHAVDPDPRQRGDGRLGPGHGARPVARTGG